ncbi:MAG: MarR family transcriptional regulator [Bacteroidetes bacterium]|nr:MarR family transcriptional regulator [Bacteroidota bacterium]
MDLIKSSGSLAIGSRFRRLSEYIMKQGEEIYALYNLDFQPRNFPVFYALSKQEKLGIMELADLLQLTHPGVIQQSKALEKQGLIESVQGEEDKRRRWLSLSAKGRKMLPDLEKVWQDIRDVFTELLDGEKENLVGNLDKLESLLQEKSFSSRVAKRRKERLGASVEIIDYDPAYGPDFPRINYSWIEAYFEIEDIDRKILEEHQKYILDKGGMIFFARINDRIVGTSALIKKEEGVYELAKMGVDTRYQGYGIGKRLGLRCIDAAKRAGARRLFLESNRRLQTALNLYKRLGFREVVRNNPNSDYKRSDIVMEMYL